MVKKKYQMRIHRNRFMKIAVCPRLFLLFVNNKVKLVSKIGKVNGLDVVSNKNWEIAA